jgi:hypothetical protein
MENQEDYYGKEEQKYQGVWAERFQLQDGAGYRA